MSEYRKLLQLDWDSEDWEALPKDIRAMPVYFRRRGDQIEFWPMWPDYVAYPEIRVSP